MNNEMKQKLEKYMQANGYYDCVAIAKKFDSSDDSDPLGLDETFAAFFGEDEYVDETDSDELKAAKEYNDKKYNNENPEEYSSLPNSLVSDAVSAQATPAQLVKSWLDSLDNDDGLMSNNQIIHILHSHGFILWSDGYQPQPTISRRAYQIAEGNY